MKRRIIDIILILVVIGLALSTYVNGKVIDVNTYQARKGKVTSIIRIDGEVDTKEEKTIAYGKECIITEFLVDEGESIRVGDPVFRIDMNYDALTYDSERENLVIALEVEKNKLIENSGNGLLVERKKLDLLYSEVEQLSKQYSSEKTLFDSGVIAKNQLNATEALLDQKQITYDEANQYYKQNVLGAGVETGKLELSINDLEKKIAYLDSQESMYASVDSEGVYYSEYRGVVENIASVGTVINKKTKLLNLAIIGDASTYKFVGYVEAKYASSLNESDEIDFYDGVIREPLAGKITKIFDAVVNGKIKVEGDFLEDRAAKISYGKEFYSEKVLDPISEQAIPKNCIIGSSELKVGEIYEIYLLTEENNVQKVEIEIEYIGDTMIGVITVDPTIKLNKIVIDPSYKVKDGEKVR